LLREAAADVQRQHSDSDHQRFKMP